MPTRVLHIIGSLRLGGAQVCLKQIVEHNNDPDIEHFVYPLRCKQVDIPIEGNILSNPYRNYDPRKFFDILKVCKKHKIDIIHAHLHKPILGGLLATYFQKTPVIVHEHGPIFRPGIQYAAYRLGLRLLSKRSYAIIANSRATAHELMRRSGVPKSNIHVIYNAVDLKNFQPDPDAREAVRQQFSFSDNDIVIGFVGRLHPVKGVDLLV
ncbi:MAG: glycosyltransferase, partial [Planctomycetota bacterium]